MTLSTKPRKPTDKERLDFITKGHTEMGRSSSGVAVILHKDGLGTYGRYVGVTPRKAIDLAIRASNKGSR